MVPGKGSLQDMAVPVPVLLKRSQGNEERQQTICQTLKKPRAGDDSVNFYLPGLAVPAISYPKTSQGIEQKCFCCIPYYCLPGTPHTVLEEKLFAPYNSGVEANSTAVAGSVQERFLVFHRSGHRTNLMFDSLITSPAQNLNMENGPPIERCGSQQKESHAKSDESANTDGFNENQETSEEGDMHEDTEEIDALLYSDTEYSDDDEASTAHSPCENKGWYQNQEGFEESADEVTSHVGAKRKRAQDEEDEDSLLRDTASSLGLSEYKDDAESGFACGRGDGNSGSPETNKRFKKGKIRDAMSILQSIIPDQEGKDTAFILDDAIKYLRFLRVKAKSLGITVE